MIEMLVVLVILALATGLMMSRPQRPGGRLQARGAATEVMQLMREARAQAIGGGHDVVFGVDPRRRILRVGLAAPRTLPAKVEVALDQGGRPAAGIVFAPDGSSPGGRVVVAEGGSRVAVSVDWLTGRISAAALP